jgi:hypothetical protein
VSAAGIIGATTADGDGDVDHIVGEYTMNNDDASSPLNQEPASPGTGVGKDPRERGGNRMAVSVDTGARSTMSRDTRDSDRLNSSSVTGLEKLKLRGGRSSGSMSGLGDFLRGGGVKGPGAGGTGSQAMKKTTVRCNTAHRKILGRFDYVMSRQLAILDMGKETSKKGPASEEY